MAYPPENFYIYDALSARTTNVAMKIGQELISVMSLVGTSALRTFIFLSHFFNSSEIWINFPISRKVDKKLFNSVLFVMFILDSSRSLLNHFGWRKLCLKPYFSNYVSNNSRKGILTFELATDHCACHNVCKFGSATFQIADNYPYS